jgi:hypothetical protein
VVTRVKDPSERSEGPTMGDELALLEKVFPLKNGMRLKTRSEPSNVETKRATLWFQMESDGIFEIHKTIFEKRERRGSSWWSNYFTTRVFKGVKSKSGTSVQRLGALEGAIIPGINRSSGRKWTVTMVIGYHLHGNR